MINQFTIKVLSAVLFTCISIPVAYADDQVSLENMSQEIVQRFGNSVFTVNAYVEKDTPQEENLSAKNRFCKNVGTAFSFGYSGYLVTLHCVVENASKIVVTSQSGEKFHASLVDTSPAGRVSVLKLGDQLINKLPLVEISNITEPKTDVLLMSVDEGEIVPLTGVINETRPPDGTFGIDAMAGNATSGTPVFDKDGQLLGLLAVQVEDDTDLSDMIDESLPHQHSYAVIPAEYIWIVSQSIINMHEGVCGWLGIKTDIIGADSDRGVTVNDVIEGSPAAKYGLRAGDRIVRFNGGVTPRFRYLMEYLTTSRAGDSASLTIIRDGAFETVQVLLAKLPGN